MIVRKREIYGPPADARLKYPRGISGASSKRLNYANKNFVQCVGAKLQPPAVVNKSRTGLYHRKCVPPGGTTKYNRPSYLSSLDANKTSGTSTCPPTFRVPVTPRCRKSLSMVDLSPGGIDHETGDLRYAFSSFHRITKSRQNGLLSLFRSWGKK